MKQIYRIVAFVLCVGCGNNAPNKNAAAFFTDTTALVETVENSKIANAKDESPSFAPIRLAVPNDLDSMALLKKSINTFEKPTFSVTTYESAFVEDGQFVGKGINSSARLYKRLPDRNGIKLFVIAYLRECHNDSYPALELQTFNSEGRCVDRLLVAVSVFEEGGLSRTSVIDSNYLIDATDVVVTYDLENEDAEETKTTTLRHYAVNDEGFFVEP